MADISKKAVSMLKKQTGCSKKTCKNALDEANGSFEQALRILRSSYSPSKKGVGFLKAILTAVLVIALLAGVGFGIYYLVTVVFDDPVGDLYEIANLSKPTKVTTEVSYKTKAGDDLAGYYVTTIDGNDVIFDYEYDRLYTPAESVADGTTDRIKHVDGTITYHDGVYSGDTDEWQPGSGAALEVKFNLDGSKLKDVVINEDGTVLTAKIDPKHSVDIIGADLKATSDISITVQTNGVNLTMVIVSCDTVNGAMTIRTSYTYNAQDLFPEQDAE